VKEFQDPAGGGWVSPQLPTAPTLANAITGAAGTELELECTAEGGNPAPRLTWFVGGTEAASTLAQADTRLADNTWTSRSRLRLPVSRADHAAQIRCEAEHDALNDAPLVGRATLNILYPPRVTASRSAADAASDNNNNAGALREGGTVTLFCDVDSNPAPSRISWRRSGAATILTSQQNFTISPVSRETAGSYECAAENMLGLSQPAVIELQVECKLAKILYNVFLYLYQNSGPVRYLIGCGGGVGEEEGGGCFDLQYRLIKIKVISLIFGS
jgi:hypothetical protein